MKKKYNFNLTLEDCLLILENIKGLVVIDQNKNIKYLSDDMIDRIGSLGNRIADSGPDGCSIDKIHPCSKIGRAFDLEKDQDLISVYVYNGQPNVARIKPVYRGDELKGAIDYDLLLGYADVQEFLKQTDKLIFNLGEL